MVDANTLENDLRRIKTAVSASINKETGRVNHEEANKQAEKLKEWIANFENLYIDRAKQRPREADNISSEGRKLNEDAWHTYETLLDFAQTASEPPAPVGYGALPSGYVNPTTKSAVITLLRDLLNDYIKFRKQTLKQ